MEENDEKETCLLRIQAKKNEFYMLHGRKMQITVAVVAVVAFHVYAGFAFAHDFHKAVALLVLMCLTYAGLLYFLVIKKWLAKLEPTLQPIAKFLSRLWNQDLSGVPICKVVALLVILIAFFTWIIIDSANSRIRLRSIAGMAMYLLLGFIFSANPGRIKWRPVICAVLLQFTVGIIVLRWPAGNAAFRWFSEQVVTFLDYALVGTAYAYGFVSSPPEICDFAGVFIFTSLQIIIYFGAIVSVLYYLGIIEAILSRVAWLMQYTVGTTAAESLNAAACIFLGQTEAAILIEPALKTMTESEIHAVMTAGFACIAGSLFSAYISFGACPTYLLSATVMSASVSLAMSKLMYPEIQDSRQKDIGSFKFATRDASNILDCICSGAYHSSKFVWAIGANLVVFIALLAFLNAVIGFLGSLVDIHDLTFNQILGYCFFPLAYMMGASDATDPAVEVQETLRVAELMGMKTFLNEFIAYQNLHEMMQNGQLAGKRAQMIATYALCGFSNISMIGSQMGILSSMCPKRKSVFARVVVRALISGMFSCFMTACVAGVLVSDPQSCEGTINANCLDLSRVAEYFNRTQEFTLLDDLVSL
ncbi:Solute carrier family 28 member 3 [Toxocara canis]|uniref:Sodium/nucleoside cotransporter n=1 Tax=Toxocara canis TaxID=6265 RepID=A0A0B2W2N2_TOXCA|nr:Solute carrier family 28 member 3 [Toxocara canis]